MLCKNLYLKEYTQYMQWNLCGHLKLKTLAQFTCLVKGPVDIH